MADEIDETLDKEAEALMLDAFGHNGSTPIYVRPWQFQLPKDKKHWREMALAKREK